MNQSRRGFLTGLGATIISAPAIIRVAPLMKIKPVLPYDFDWRQKTPEEILNDINSMLMKLMEQSGPIPYTNAPLFPIRYLSPSPVRYIDFNVPLDKKHIFGV